MSNVIIQCAPTVHFNLVILIMIPPFRFFYPIYAVRLEGEFFEAFILQARSSGGGPYNKLPQAGVGRFVGAPQVCLHFFF